MGDQLMSCLGKQRGSQFSHWRLRLEIRIHNYSLARA